MVGGACELEETIRQKQYYCETTARLFLKNVLYVDFTRQCPEKQDRT